MLSNYDEYSNFLITYTDAHSAQIELESDFVFPQNGDSVWLEIGSSQIGTPPPNSNLKALADSTNNNAKSCDDGKITWCRHKTLSPAKQRIKVKNLQSNFQYFVRLSTYSTPSDIFTDEDVFKCFWTEDWLESDKTPTTVVRIQGAFQKEYDIGRRLGRGHFGDVHLCRNKSASDDQWIYAVKVMKVARKQQIEMAQNEICILQQLCHENVVWLKQAFWEPRATLYLVMEYITGGELFEKISGDDFFLTELDCTCFLYQICHALAYIHSKSIVHLDLKVENIMLSSPQRRLIKIIDFGISRQLAPGEICKVMCGTAEFCAPEVLNFDPISLRTDMWSVGVIAYIMLSGLSPYLGDNDAETHANVVSGEYTYDDPAFEPISDQAKDFIAQLLILQKDQRMTAEECLAHDWLVVASKTFDTNHKPPSTAVSLEDIESLDDEEFDMVSYGRRISITAIDTKKLRTYWARRKWKTACGVLRAVHRISAAWTQRNSVVAPTSPPIAEEKAFDYDAEQSAK